MRGGLRRARLGCTCCTASPRSRTLPRTADLTLLFLLVRYVELPVITSSLLHTYARPVRSCATATRSSPLLPPMPADESAPVARPAPLPTSCQTCRCAVQTPSTLLDWALTRSHEQAAQDSLPALGGRSGPVSAVSQEGDQLRLRRAVKDSQTIREERRGSEGTLRQRRAGLVRPVDLFIIIVVVFVRLAAV